jgi:hypothetical protein
MLVRTIVHYFLRCLLRRGEEVSAVANFVQIYLMTKHESPVVLKPHSCLRLHVDRVLVNYRDKRLIRNAEPFLSHERTS